LLEKRVNLNGQLFCLEFFGDIVKDKLLDLQRVEHLVVVDVVFNLIWSRSSFVLSRLALLLVGWLWFCRFRVVFGCGLRVAA
jgi:hypothetical protein